MKVTELNEELIKEIESTSLYLIRAINSYRKNKKHKFTHKKIGASMSTPISQSTVSKMLMESNVDDSDDPYGNLSISEAKELCAAMGTTLGNVLLEYEQQFAQDSGGYDKDNSQEYSVKKTTTNIPEQCYNIPGRETTIYPACLFSENDSLTMTLVTLCSNLGLESTIVIFTALCLMKQTASKENWTSRKPQVVDAAMFVSVLFTIKRRTYGKNTTDNWSYQKNKMVVRIVHSLTMMIKVRLLIWSWQTRQ